MEDIVGVFLSWQFLLVGVVVYFVFRFCNDFVGPNLWKVYRIRKILVWLEGSKLIWPPLFGFALGWVPGMPRPAPLEDSSSLTVAMLFLVAGLYCQWIVKGIRKALAARGVNLDLDLAPKDQLKVKKW